MGRRWPLSGPPTVGSGGGGRPRRACLILALVCCSPVLVPLACFSVPFLCIAGLCLRGGRRWGRRKTPGFKEGGVPAPELAKEGRLLPRYLEDQLRLVSDVYAVDDDVKPHASSSLSGFGLGH
ncbi:uncharacterized protein LOC122001021 [Zingiber officinale]|uniref:Uncharacterized protein n=1 Tax=Zingiber officinale TaxID=94328 RepID=A0A8J5FQ53_ZINOF|nr:uncharacterized protein LOC122001021 [Zingiber officinale]KAG6492044.1 hypothetical protein ZIOFF_046994 [Zingiber officinale]